jgi:acyl dehydratase
MAMMFKSSPSLWSLYPKVLAARKPAGLREGASVPRIEAQIPQVRVDAAHLRAYREICGVSATDTLPIAYPHVLASGLHLAVLSSHEFPVRLLGLVHVRNRIRQLRPLQPSESGQLSVAVEGHVDTPRGQEFTLATQWRDEAGAVVWEEECVFLARRRTSDAERSPSRESEAASRRGQVRTTSFRAPAGLGRSYGVLGGDLNPIHLSDLSARMFGFRGAIAHGMWSLARVAADLDQALFEQPCDYEVAFKLPVFLPAWLLLEQWANGDDLEFALRDNEGQKPHLTGRLRSLA